MYAHYHARTGPRKKRTHVRQQHAIVDVSNTGTHACALPDCLTTCVRWTLDNDLSLRSFVCCLRTKPNVSDLQRQGATGAGAGLGEKQMALQEMPADPHPGLCLCTAQRHAPPVGSVFLSYLPPPVARAGP